MLPKIGNEKSLSQRAYLAIKKAILNNDLKPNEILGEEALATSLGISRTPLREALKQLQAEKLVTINSAKQSFVAALNKEDIMQVMLFRFAIETMASRVAALEHEKNDMAKIQDCLKRHEKNIEKKQIEKIILCEVEFSALIAQSTKNIFLIESVERINVYMQRFLALSNTMGRDVTYSIEEHKNIFEAIKSSDAVLAEKLTHAHLSNVTSRLGFELTL